MLRDERPSRGCGTVGRQATGGSDLVCTVGQPATCHLAASSSMCNEKVPWDAFLSWGAHFGRRTLVIGTLPWWIVVSLLPNLGFSLSCCRFGSGLASFGIQLSRFVLSSRAGRRARWLCLLNAVACGDSACGPFCCLSCSVVAAGCVQFGLAGFSIGDRDSRQDTLCWTLC